MKHISKLLVLVLALVMVLSLFAGCNPVDPTDAPTDPKTETQNPGTNETDPPATQDGIFPLAEKKTFKIYVRTANDIDSILAVDGWYKEVVERTNVEIEFISLGSDSATAASTLNAAFISGDYGHGYIGNILSADQVVEAGTGGYLLPLNDLVTEEVMPNYTAALAELGPDTLSSYATTDGNVYTLARINQSSKMSSVESPLMINMHWLKAAGLTDVDTIEKFETYLKYVKEADANGNGDANDEIPFMVVSTSALDAQNHIYGIMNWWGNGTKDGANEFALVIKNGEVQLAPETAGYRAGITKIAEWYKEGYLWDQFFTGKTADMKSLLMDSEIPVVGAYVSSAWEPYDSEKFGDENPNDGVYDNSYYQSIACPVPEGYTPTYFVNPGLAGYRDCYAITNKCTEEEAKILLAWMDVAFLSIEGSMGSTGSYWKQNEQPGFENWINTGAKAEDGTLSLVKLTTEEYETVNKPIEDKYPQGFYLYAVCGTFTYCYPPSYYQSGMGQAPMRFREMEKIADHYEQYWNNEIWYRPYKTTEQATDLAFLWPDIKAVMTEWETKFLSGELEINDTNWNAYMKALYKADSRELVEILQEVYDATKQ